MTDDNILPFRPREIIPSVHEKWNELYNTYGPPARVPEVNPYPFGSELWRAFQQGVERTNEQWRTAWLGKLTEAGK